MLDNGIRFALGLVLQSPGEFIFRLPMDWKILGGVGLRWYGVTMTLAVLVAFFLSRYLAEYRRLETEPGRAAEEVESVALGIVIGGFAGARLYYVLTHLEDYSSNPWGIFAIWQGGIIIHGGILAGVAFMFLYARRTGINPWKYGDVMMPGVILGQAIGRWGNFFNSEAYGAPIPNDSWWPIKEFIPPEMRVVDPKHGIDFSQFQYYHPIFLYEMVLNLLLFALLMGMIWKAPKLKEGTLVWTYLVGYSLIRIPYEILRVSAVAYIGNTPIKAAYVASAVGIVLGVGMLVYMYRFRFDPDLEEITQWLTPQVNLDPLAVENLVQRAWKIQQQNRRSDLVERVELAMPNFPLSLSESLSVRERQRILHNLFRQLEGQPVLGSDSQV